MRDLILLVLGSALLGSIPWAYILVKVVTGLDIRQVGDGNVGARNAWRVAGAPVGLVVLALDGSKGSLACALAQRHGTDWPFLYLAGIAVLIGHAFTPWLAFHGGKGLAAISGFALVLWPVSTLAGAFVLLVLGLRKTSFDQRFAAAVVTTLLASLLVEHNDLSGAGLLVLLLCLAGLKKLLDIPRERSLQATASNGMGPGATE
ncbi:MAG: glycerol-3-phosphate acyltransferase [Anaerolineae bacterium]